MWIEDLVELEVDLLKIVVAYWWIEWIEEETWRHSSRDTTP